MPRIVNGVIQPSAKKKNYEQLDEEKGNIHFKNCCKCNGDDCNLNCINCQYCDTHCQCKCCGSCTFLPSMLLTIDAFIGYIILISVGLLSYFVSWTVGIIVFVICCGGYAFWLNYRCCGGGRNNGNNNNLGNDINDADPYKYKYKHKSNKNKTRKTGIMGIDDLPKTKKGG